MTDYKNYEYWKRRFQRNTLDVSQNDLKIFFNVLLDRINDLEQEVQYLRSSTTSRSRKKLEANSGDSKDS